MPSDYCNMNSNQAEVFDRLLSVVSYSSFGFSILCCLCATYPEKNRQWPKRTELYLLYAFSFVQFAWSLGAVVDYKQLEPSGSGMDSLGKIGNSSWETSLCFSQGILFQFAAFVTVLTFIWYTYSRYLMLCKGVASAKVASKEFPVLYSIVVISFSSIAVPIVFNDIGQSKNFYTCWVKGPFFDFFNGLLCVSYLLTLFCSTQTIRSLNELDRTMNTIETRKLVQKFKFVNYSFLLCLSYMFVVLILDIYAFHNNSSTLCYMMNLNIPAAGFVAVFSMYGFVDIDSVAEIWIHLTSFCRTINNQDILDNLLVNQESEDSDFTFD